MKTDLTIVPDYDLYALLCNEKVCNHAFKELYRRYEHKVWAYCRITLGNDDKAKDAVQESFVRFFRTGQKGTAIDNVGAYLMRIVRNVCLDEKKRSATLPITLDEIDMPILGNDYEKKEMASVMESALQLLSDEQKEALIMQTFGNMSYSEIAEVQGVPLTTIRNRIVRAKKRLREILTPYLNHYE